jgi:hypothetical protein
VLDPAGSRAPLGLAAPATGGATTTREDCELDQDRGGYST